MIRMLLLTLLFFFGPAILMFAAHRGIMILRLWWHVRQHSRQQKDTVINITPTKDPSLQPSGIFIAASMIVALGCAFIAWQSIEQQPVSHKYYYAPAHLDNNGTLIPAQTKPLPPTPLKEEK